MKTNQFNKNHKPYGFWKIYYNNGNLRCKGNYINGNQYGYWETFNNSKKFYLR